VKYLVDANVLSEPTKPSPDMRVVDWDADTGLIWAELLARLHRCNKVCHQRGDDC
jgi:predicted nucleic acid-binding protein